jgi:hypothetical protein
MICSLLDLLRGLRLVHKSRISCSYRSSTINFLNKYQGVERHRCNCMAPLFFLLVIVDVNQKLIKSPLTASLPNQKQNIWSKLQTVLWLLEKYKFNHTDFENSRFKKIEIFKDIIISLESEIPTPIIVCTINVCSPFALMALYPLFTMNIT